MAFFGHEDLPRDLLLGQRQRILDAFVGVDGSVVRSEHAGWPFDQPMTRQELYQLRDQSGLPRSIWPSRCSGSSCAEPFLASIRRRLTRSFSGWRTRSPPGTTTRHRLRGAANAGSDGSELDNATWVALPLSSLIII